MSGPFGCCRRCRWSGNRGEQTAAAETERHPSGGGCARTGSYAPASRQFHFDIWQDGTPEAHAVRIPGWDPSPDGCGGDCGDVRPCTG